MGRRRPRTLRHAAGFDHDDGLDPCCGARRRHELARILDGFDVEQDGVGLFVHREIVQEVGDVDVELIADRHDAGKADRALRRPIHHARGDGARLRDQRQISLGGHVRGKARIEAGAGHHDAEAVRADQPHAVFLRGLFRLVRQRARTMAEPCADDERARSTATAGLVDQAGDRFGRRRDDDQFRRKIELAEAIDRRDAIDRGIARIDQPEFALELRFAHIAENGAADGTLARTGTDKRNRIGRQQIFQAIGRHRCLLSGRWRPL